MPEATVHEDNDTPKVSGTGIKRCDADTVVGLGDSKDQAIGFSPTNGRLAANIQNAPKTTS
jgi:hypothetical protein